MGNFFSCMRIEFQTFLLAMTMTLATRGKPSCVPPSRKGNGWGKKVLSLTLFFWRFLQTDMFLDSVRHELYLYLENVIRRQYDRANHNTQ